jgi:hypothetical protein
LIPLWLAWMTQSRMFSNIPTTLASKAAPL